MATTQERNKSLKARESASQNGNGSYAGPSAEMAVVASVMYEWPNGGYPALKRVLDGAPGSFLDARLGALVCEMKFLLGQVGEVDTVMLARQNPGVSNLICELAGHDVSLALAELEAQKVLADWQGRRLYEGLTKLRKDVEADPQSAVAGAPLILGRLAEELKETPADGKGIRTGYLEQFAQYEAPKDMEILGSYLSGGSVSMLVGQGGLGKSRLSLCLAVAQITGKEWCGLETGGGDKRWLMLGVENSMRRLSGDARNILARLTADERSRVNNFLRIQWVESIEDGVPEDFSRITQTVRELGSEVVVVDPLSDWIDVDDYNSAGEMRRGTRTLIAAIRRANPNAAILLLHHARTGKQNILQAVGYDAANFASGSKALHQMVRCQMNLAPASEEDRNQLVLACAKSNDAEHFKARGLIYEHARCDYQVNPDFDFEKWKDNLDGKKTGQSVSIADVVGALRKGLRSTGEICDALKESTGASMPTIKRRLGEAMEKQYIESAIRGQYNLGEKSKTIK